MACGALAFSGHCSGRFLLSCLVVFFFFPLPLPPLFAAIFLTCRCHSTFSFSGEPRPRYFPAAVLWVTSCYRNRLKVYVKLFLEKRQSVATECFVSAPPVVRPPGFTRREAEPPHVFGRRSRVAIFALSGRVRPKELGRARAGPRCAREALRFLSAVLGRWIFSALFCLKYLHFTAHADE